MSQAYTLGEPVETTDARSLDPGTVLDERYLVERLIGAGGMGYVVAAKHLQLPQRVAIKLVLPEKMSAHGRVRLVREARTVARLKSDHVVRVLDVVSSGPNAPYIVMEFLDGETLAERIKRKGSLETLEVVELMIQACEAVGEAHLLGVVHRDLKPSNLFLLAQPGRGFCVKVLDFGISKTGEGDSERLTHSQALLASPAYASPEQLRTSHDVDHRADIWSLGVIAYECLTGRLPFPGASLPEMCAHILRETPAPLRNWRTDVPPALERTVLRCLDKDPTHRFGSIQELVLSLRQFAPGSARKCLAYLRAVEDPDAFNSSRPNTPSSRGLPAASRRWWWLGVTAIVLGGVAAVTLHRAHRAPPRAVAASSTASTLAKPPAPVRTTAPPTAPAPTAAPITSAGIVVVPVDEEAVPPAATVRATRPHARETTPAHPPRASSSAPADAPWVESR